MLYKDDEPVIITKNSVIDDDFVYFITRTFNRSYEKSDLKLLSFNRNLLKLLKSNKFDKEIIQNITVIIGNIYESYKHKVKEGFDSETFNSTVAYFN